MRALIDEFLPGIIAAAVFGTLWTGLAVYTIRSETAARTASRQHDLVLEAEHRGPRCVCEWCLR